MLIVGAIIGAVTALLVSDLWRRHTARLNYEPKPRYFHRKTQTECQLVCVASLHDRQGGMAIMMMEYDERRHGELRRLEAWPSQVIDSDFDRLP